MPARIVPASEYPLAAEVFDDRALLIVVRPKATWRISYRCCANTSPAGIRARGRPLTSTMTINEDEEK